MLQDPNFSNKIERVLNQIKPEAVYFALAEGERGIYLIVNLPSDEMMGTVIEPLWTIFNCKSHINFTPVMELSDIQKWLQKK